MNNNSPSGSVKECQKRFSTTRSVDAELTTNDEWAPEELVEGEFGGEGLEQSAQTFVGENRCGCDGEDVAASIHVPLRGEEGPSVKHATRP